MKQQSGFTLIELIMVIAILGVLSAFALPKFADLGKEARLSNLKGMAGALKSAANIAHAKQLVGGLGSNASVELEGGVTVTMANGYPTADADGIEKTVSLDGFTAEAGSGLHIFKVRDNCHVTYTASTGSGVVPVIGDEKSGC